jgi:hypothetical protein
MVSGCLSSRTVSGCLSSRMVSGCLSSRMVSGCLSSRMVSGCTVFLFPFGFRKPEFYESVNYSLQANFSYNF